VSRESDRDLLSVSFLAISAVVLFFPFSIVFSWQRICFLSAFSSFQSCKETDKEDVAAVSSWALTCGAIFRLYDTGPFLFPSHGFITRCGPFFRFSCKKTNKDC